MKKKIIRVLGIVVVALGVAFGVLKVVSKFNKKSSVYKDEPWQKNPMAGKKVIFVEDEDDEENADGVRGHLEAVGVSMPKGGFYNKYLKRWIDTFLSFCGLVVLAPVYACISLAIIIDDPGPVLFTQKRVGENKEYFKLHKFRSMKMCTPHDVPTHMLDNPDQYITKVGKILRKYSLDELPQIWDIFIGNMSIIGPRPGLWNQDLLTAERDKYGANDVKPGLTGWAQINGRDELEIPVKANLDGEYVQKQSLLFDIRCFFGTIISVANADGVVEGGTGEMKKIGRHFTDGKTKEELIGQIGFSEEVVVDKTAHKKVLITGANSYIGDSFCNYVKENYSENFIIDTVDMIDGSWREKDFSGYDIVYHVAGIAHAEVGNVSDEVKEMYYAINTDLAVEVCEKAREEGVKEFIFMSSMIVYGDSAPYGKKKVITRDTVPTPANFYGDSKLQADVAVRDLATDDFKVMVLRPPMIYGKGSKGNYPLLAKIAKKLPVFPNIKNERSMLYVGNLCEFLAQLMLTTSNDNVMVFLPQNQKWTRTSDMVKRIRETFGKEMYIINVLNSLVWIGSKIPGKISGLVNKAFGSLCYEDSISEYSSIRYTMYTLEESIVLTEGNTEYKSFPVLSKKQLENYSVLMSVYKNDNARYLQEAIESMLNQTIAPEQFVVVIDGPVPDKIQFVIDRYKQRNDNLFTIVKLEENGGLGNALNNGLAECRNELVARMDADDISKPNRIEKQIEFLSNHQDYVLIGTQIDEFIGEKNNIVSKRIVPSSLDDIRVFAKRRVPFNHPTVIFRKSVIENFGGYMTYGRKEDLDLFLRIVFSRYKVGNLDESLLWYRTNDNNLKRRKSFINCKEYILIMYGFYQKGYIGKNDMLYVLLGQLFMWFMPLQIVGIVSKKMLRKE